MTIREILNDLDIYCLDEDLHFYDFRSLYEGMEKPLTDDQKKRINDVAQKIKSGSADAKTMEDTLTSIRIENDPALKSIVDKKLNEDADSLQSRIFDFLDDLGGYADYNQRVEDVSDEFNMSPDEAENYVWNWCLNTEAEWNDTADQEESLQEKLVDAPQEVIDELVEILDKHGFILDPEFDENPSRSLIFGDVHLQVINPNSFIDTSDEVEVQNKLKEYVSRDLINEIHELDKRTDCPITWNFGPNKEGQVTGGLDIMKQWIPDEEELEESLNSKKKLDENLMDAVLDRADGVRYNPRKFYNYIRAFGYKWYDNIISEMDNGEEEDVANAIVDAIKRLIRVDGGNPDNKNAQQLYQFIRGSTWLTNDRTAEKPQYLKDIEAEQNSDYDYSKELDGVLPDELEEDYQSSDDSWGDPYTFDEVERELKKITNGWKDKDGTIRCYYEQEKEFGKQILKKYYKYVDVSDGRTGPGEEMSWVIAYARPKEPLDESFDDRVVKETEDYRIVKDSLNGKKDVYSLWLQSANSREPRRWATTTMYFNTVEEAEDYYNRKYLDESYFKLSNNIDKNILDNLNVPEAPITTQSMKCSISAPQNALYYTDKGEQVQLCIGNAGEKNSKINTHAWVVHNGKIAQTNNTRSNDLYANIIIDLIPNNVEKSKEIIRSKINSLDESLTESRISRLQAAIIDCLDWFIMMEMEFPKDKFLADSWEDVKDGIVMGIDPEFEVAEGIVEYFKPIVTFNDRYNKEVEEEGIFQDEIELYKKLVDEMNRYLKDNGYDDTISY